MFLPKRQSDHVLRAAMMTHPRRARAAWTGGALTSMPRLIQVACASLSLALVHLIRNFVLAAQEQFRVRTSAVNDFNYRILCDQIMNSP